MFIFHKTPKCYIIRFFKLYSVDRCRCLVTQQTWWTWTSTC